MPTPEEQARAHAAVEALKLLAGVGVEMRTELEQKVRWLSIQDGAIFFNNEYTLEKDELVEIALLLLGYARVMRKL